MDWIKRNLYFLIGGVVALVLMGAAGWFLYSKLALNQQITDKLSQDYSELDNLNKQKPHPGNGPIDNIKLAREQQQQLRAYIAKARKSFRPIARIPDLPKITDRDYSSALSRTIDQLQRDATNSSVTLNNGYNFSFEAQKNRVTFATGSLEPLSTQLGEVKAICDVLFRAKVNSLDGIRRERVSTDDSNGSPNDYLIEKSTTNELAVVTPYELTFRCFSAELASVLAGLATAPDSLMVKTINVEVAPLTAPGEPGIVATPASYVTPMAQPAVTRALSAESEAFSRRYGLPGGGPRGDRYRGAGEGGVGGGYTGGVPLRDPGAAPTPTPGYVQPVQPGVTPMPLPGRGGLQTVLDEKQLKVTLMLYVVKLLPPGK